MFHEELARIDAAKPDRHREGFGNPSERLKHTKKVKLGAGYVYVPRNPKPLRRIATAEVKGCDSRTYTSPDGDVEVPIPQPPGVTAKRVGRERILVTYRIGGKDERCRAKWIELTADVSDDLLPGIGKSFPVGEQRSGQIVLRLLDPIVNADHLIASTRTKLNSGLASRTTTIRIR